MRRILRKKLLMAALMSCSCLPAANAAEPLQEFVLDPMVVTAQGFATQDLDTPAIVEVFNQKEIDESGASNAFDVLQNTLGASIASLLLRLSTCTALMRTAVCTPRQANPSVCRP